MHDALRVLAALTIVGGGTAAAAPSSPWRDGIASYYTVPGSACNLPSPPSGLHTAIGNEDFAGGAVCGAHIEIRVKGRAPIEVAVTNRCPECRPGHLDLWPAAFSRLAPLPVGLIRDLKWRFVPAPVSGPVQISVHEGSSRWWTALQVRNHRYPIARLEVRRRGWETVPRSSWGYFVAERGLGPGPYTLRITDNRGQRIVERGVPLQPGQVIPGRSQLPG